MFACILEYIMKISQVLTLVLGIARCRVHLRTCVALQENERRMDEHKGSILLLPSTVNPVQSLPGRNYTLLCSLYMSRLPTSP